MGSLRSETTVVTFESDHHHFQEPPNMEYSRNH